MKNLVVTLLAIAFLSGCATYHKQPENIYPEPRSDMALVYFYKEAQFFGGATSFNIKHKDEVIGAVGYGTYFFKFCEPGQNTFTATTESTDSKTLNLEAGKSYYIRCDVDMGLFVGRPDLTIVTAEEGWSEIQNLTYAIK